MSELEKLSFTVSGFIGRPPAEVYEAVADPAILSRYFTTGGARGRMETGATVSWDFHDFPGRFDVQVLKAEPPHRIIVEWLGEATIDARDRTQVTFTFRPVDDGARTEVLINESGWQPTQAGADNAFGNCDGWSGMLAAMKVWLEHGINLREGYYK